MKSSASSRNAIMAWTAPLVPWPTDVETLGRLAFIIASRTPPPIASDNVSASIWVLTRYAGAAMSKGTTQLLPPKLLLLLLLQKRSKMEVKSHLVSFRTLPAFESAREIRRGCRIGWLVACSSSDILRKGNSSIEFILEASNLALRLWYWIWSL